MLMYRYTALALNRDERRLQHFSTLHEAWQRCQNYEMTGIRASAGMTALGKDAGSTAVKIFIKSYRC